MTDSSYNSPGKIKSNGHKRKMTSDVELGSKLKKIKSEDTSSVFSLSLSTAYGAHESSNDSDIDDDLLSISESERTVNFVPLDTSLLNRNSGVLFSEDLTNDNEVWTFQCPEDVNINDFHKQAIDFNEVSTLKINNSLSNKVDLIPYHSQVDTSILIMTPSEKTKKLSLNVVPLSGTLVLSNRVKNEKLHQKLLPVDTIEDAIKRRSKLMSKITKSHSNKDITIEIAKIKKEFKIENESPKKNKK